MGCAVIAGPPQSQEAMIVQSHCNCGTVQYDVTRRPACGLGLVMLLVAAGNHDRTIWKPLVKRLQIGVCFIDLHLHCRGKERHAIPS